MERIVLILLSIVTMANTQGGVWGPYDSRCPLVDDPVNPAHLPHETYCTKFYKCFDRQRVEFDCQPGTEWPYMDMCVGWQCACDWPWSAQCNPANLPPLPPWNGTTIAPPTSTTTLPSQTTTSAPPPGLSCPPFDNPNVLVFLPHETFCDRYYLCFNGGRIERQCAFGFIWDQQRTWCNFPNEVNCPLMECPMEDDENRPVFLPNYEECDKYFLCFNGMKIPRSCHNGLRWNREKNGVTMKKKFSVDFNKIFK